MSTYIYTIDDFIKALQKLEDEGIEQVLVGEISSGNILAPSPKHNSYRIPVSFSGACFKTNTLGNLCIFESAQDSNLLLPVLFIHKNRVKDLNFPKEEPKEEKPAQVPDDFVQQGAS